MEPVRKEGGETPGLVFAVLLLPLLCCGLPLLLLASGLSLAILAPYWPVAIAGLAAAVVAIIWFLKRRRS